jgi:hypothetical protein
MRAMPLLLHMISIIVLLLSPFGRCTRTYTVTMYWSATKQSLHAQQIDLVPTLSLLLGAPIPFGSLGGIIPEMFAGLYAHEQTEKLQDKLHATTADNTDTNDNINHDSGGSSASSRDTDGNQAAEAYGKFTHIHMLAV